ncbi:aminoglycoside phosphotransferase [Streptomyces sp. NBC_01716]|uniref:aminoglycoside phosphotransferase n=1 Tax=Streptomyces sp. NBC_01716 TaxID=2975917 RepID=UPI002E332DA1|nr:aminoglycoside phosphotransferase [Streptomyces sp. NBC_01716]
MTRTEWADLPSAVRHAIEARTGPVADAATADKGVMSPFASVLHTARGPVFAKGTPDAGQSWMYRAEAEVTRTAPLAPALLWQVDAGGWIVAGYEFISGRHPDLSPGSADIPALVDALRVMSGAPWPEAVRKKPLPARWGNLLPEGYADDLAGRSLAHTDMSPLNMLATPQGIRLVDWALACPAPAWADTAFTVPRLILAGHTPGQAEEIARQVPAFANAPETAVSVFVRTLRAVWEAREAADPLPHRAPLSAAVRSWAESRMARPGR